MICRMPDTTYVIGMYGLIAWKNGGVVWMGNVPAHAVSCSMSRMMATNLPGNPERCHEELHDGREHDRRKVAHGVESGNVVDLQLQAELKHHHQKRRLG